MPAPSLSSGPIGPGCSAFRSTGKGRRRRRSPARSQSARSSSTPSPTSRTRRGSSRRRSRRAELAERAVAAGVLLVEDAFDADLFVEGELPPPLAALAPAHVVHLGTLSKALFPGVRVGWISGPKEFVHRLAALKRVGELTSSPVLQAALNLFLARGEFDRHLARTRARLKTRLALAHRVIRERFPVGTRCERPFGGWVLWIELPDGVPGRALAAAAREKGVLVSAGAELPLRPGRHPRRPRRRCTRDRRGPRACPRDRGGVCADARETGGADPEDPDRTRRGRGGVDSDMKRKEDPR